MAELKEGEELVCESHDCDGWVVAEFRWPGQDWLKVCAFCVARAHGIAEVMGFTLEAKVHPQRDQLIERILGESRTRRLEVD